MMVKGCTVKNRDWVLEISNPGEARMRFLNGHANRLMRILSICLVREEQKRKRSLPSLK